MTTTFFSYGHVGFELVTALIKILFMVLGFLMPVASILTWLERRQSAMMQDRLGPNRAYIVLPFMREADWGRPMLPVQLRFANSRG